MSTRAYKVIVPAKLADSQTWNATHDEYINEYLGLNYHDGEQSVEVRKIQEMLEDSSIILDNDTEKQFRKDIAGEDPDGDIYYCLF